MIQKNNLHKQLISFESKAIQYCLSSVIKYYPVTRFHYYNGFFSLRGEGRSSIYCHTIRLNLNSISKIKFYSQKSMKNHQRKDGEEWNLKCASKTYTEKGWLIKRDNEKIRSKAEGCIRSPVCEGFLENQGARKCAARSFLKNTTPTIMMTS